MNWFHFAIQLDQHALACHFHPRGRRRFDGVGQRRFHRRNPGSGQERDAVTAGTCHAVFHTTVCTLTFRFSRDTGGQAFCGVTAL